MKYKKELFKLFNDSIVFGGVTILDGNEIHKFGDQSRESNVELKVNNGDKLYKSIFIDGNLGLAEIYIHGYFEMQRGEIYDLLIILLKSRI